MSVEPTVLHLREGAVVTIVLNRPEKLNALNAQLLTELHAVLLTLQADSAVLAAVITGSGEKAFAAGADIEAMSTMTGDEARAFASLGQGVNHLIESLHFPVIAAVNGFALGGGCELALACDFIYASERAKFGQPEVNLGVIPGFGGTQRLMRRVGAALARELCYTGDIVDSAEALRTGLANKVFPPADLLLKAQEAAKKIAGKGPLAVRACKRVILTGEHLALTLATDLETEAFADIFGSHDQREGMAAFLAKRPAAFTGA